MASTQTQNCQRGVVFLCFLNVAVFLVFIIIKLVKKQIDSVDAYESGEHTKKYEEGQEKNVQAKAEESNAGFDQVAIKSSEIVEDDTPIIKICKRIYELEVFYMPILAIFPLNLITGTTKAYSIIGYFFIMALLLIFNVFKLHRDCIQHKVVRVIIESLWIVFSFFLLLNVWTTEQARQPYVILGA